MQQLGPFDLAATVVTVVVLGTAGAVALAVSAKAFTAAIHSIGHRHSSRSRERLFVGRWGDLGPELYLVGKRVRRLRGPEVDRDACEDRSDPAALAFARRMLAEVMHRRPATRLAQAFADEELDPLAADGFVLAASDVEAWLESRRERLEPAP